MLKACDLERDSVVEINRAPHLVEEIQRQTPSARGAATIYKVRFRNVATGQKLDQSLHGDDVFKDLELDRREVQYLYKDGDSYTFMDAEDFSQFTRHADEIKDLLPFLTDGLEGIIALIVNEQIVALQLPPIVTLQVVECEPVVRGASATGRSKPATLSTGHTVQVPEYLEAGEQVRVDTRTGRFVSRA